MKIKIFLSISLIAFILLSSSVYSSTIGFLGNKPAPENLTNEEYAAYTWLNSNYSVNYIYIDLLKENQSLLNNIDVLWWHYGYSANLYAPALSSEVINTIRTFISGGGGLFLSGFAPQYVVNLGLETTVPQEINESLTTSGNWGIYQRNTSHSIFKGLSNPFITLSAGLQTMNTICWWNKPETFNGTWLGDTEWNSKTLVAVGEYKLGGGKVVFVGAGAYDWYLDNGINTQRSNLEKFTLNIINYLIPSPIKIGLLSVKELTPDENNAYTWAGNNFKTVAITSDDIISRPELLDSVSVLWWHYDEDTVLPSAVTGSNFISLIKLFLSKNNGLLLTGFAARYAVDLGFEVNLPDNITSIEGLSSASGFYKTKTGHAIFDGFINPAITVSSGLSTTINNCTWVGTKFSGEILADDERHSGVVTCGEYNLTKGKLVVIGSPAFDWYVSGGNNSYRSNLEKLAFQAISYLDNQETEYENNLYGLLKLNENTGSSAKEEINNLFFPIQNNFNEPEWVKGVSGSALRLDGYSTWITGDFGTRIESFEALSVEAWIALEAYPVSDAAIINQRDAQSGYFIGLNKLGKYYFTISLNNEWYTCTAVKPFPKNKWAHITATFSNKNGIKIYLNGELTASASTANTSFLPDFDSPVFIGRSNLTEYNADVYPIGALNGMIDEIKFYNKELTSEEVAASFNSVKTLPVPDFSVPAFRFASDIQRPAYHAIPASAWTNEPHGIMYIKGKYHMFFQKNPNGPYWGQIHWGHLVSDDLFAWKETEIALAPEGSLDSKGIWSGCAVNDNETGKIIYTAVDDIRARICLATGSEDLETWTKYSGNPLINNPPSEYDHMDFRDPFVWRSGSYYYMIIGSGINDVGGTAFLYKSSDLISWQFLHPLLIGDKNTSGIFWEMPVFVRLGNKYMLLVCTVESRGAARALYWIGDWINEMFIPDSPEPKQMDLFNHMLSPSPAVDEQGRLVAIGIVADALSANLQFSQGWAHLFSLPRVWTLGENSTLKQNVHPDVVKLRTDSLIVKDLIIEPDSTGYINGVRGRQVEIIAEFDLQNSSRAGVIVCQSPAKEEQTLVYYNSLDSTINIDLSKSSLTSGVTGKRLLKNRYILKQDKKIKIHVFVDHSVLDVFIDDEAAFSKRIYPSLSESCLLDVFAEGGNAILGNLQVYLLKEAVTSVGSNNNLETPEEFQVYQNYPNPFNPETNIQFTLKSELPVSIVIYDSIGRKVKELVSNEIYQAGTYTLTWDGKNTAGTNCASGIYYYTFNSATLFQTNKMVLLR